MDSLRTAFRLVVMLCGLWLGYKGWQLYGPPAEQLKSLALRALEAAKTALDNGGQSREEAAALTADPRPITSPLAAPKTLAPVPALVPAGGVVQTQALVPATDLPAPAPITPPALAAVPTRLPAPDPSLVTSEENVSLVAAGDEAGLQALYSRLEQLGAHDPRLTAWGSSVQLYRFSCQASLAGAANFNRHFDAVDADPHKAVEAVVAKVSTWRNAQRETASPGSTLR